MNLLFAFVFGVFVGGTLARLGDRARLKSYADRCEREAGNPVRAKIIREAAENL